MEPSVSAESTGTVKGFVHKVKVKPDVQLVQMKLRRLPFTVRDQVSEELQRLEKDAHRLLTVGFAYRGGEMQVRPVQNMSRPS